MSQLTGKAREIFNGWDEAKTKEISTKRKMTQVDALEFANEASPATSEVAMANVIMRLLNGGADEPQLQTVIRRFAVTTRHSKVYFNALLKAVRKLRCETTLAAPRKANVIVVNEHGFDQQIDMGKAWLKLSNEDGPHLPDKGPYLFRNGAEKAELQYIPERDTLSIHTLDRKEFTRVLNERFQFANSGEDPNSLRSVACPRDLADHLYDSTLEVPYLERIIRAPTFAADDSLVVEPGYHASCRAYYLPPKGVDIPAIPLKPTEADLKEARRLIVEEMMGDFPFDGWSREDLLKVALGDDPTTPPPASLLNAIGFAVEQFVRPMITGNMPATLFTKPTPRTGATLLVNAIQMVVSGDTSTQVLPVSEEEKEKRIVAMLRGSTAINLWDNVTGEISSASLAQLFTSSTFKGRELGSSRLLTLPVASSFAFTGNNPRFSRELAARIGRVRLDARVEDPGARSQFRHRDLIGWIEQNRGKLIWAFLVLVQNWIAQGRPAPRTIWPDGATDDVTWGGYASYVTVIGGIISAAAPNWTTWQTNRNESADESGEDDPIKDLLSTWLHEKKGAEMLASDLIDLAATHHLHLPVKLIDRTDPGSFDRAAFGKWLGEYRSRVFNIDGVELELQRSAKRTNKGWKWSLAPVAKPATASTVAHMPDTSSKQSTAQGKATPNVVTSLSGGRGRRQRRAAA